MKDLIEEKKQLKKKTPKFLKQESHRRKRLGNKDHWRKPKGVHSKIRLSRKGKRLLVSIGYKSPVILRNADSSGRIPIIINNVLELKNMDINKNFAIISAKVGNKKKISILEEAKKLKITFANIKNIDEFIKNLKDSFEKRKSEKKQRLEEKKKKEEAKKKKIEEKKKKESKKEKESKEKSVDEKEIKEEVSKEVKELVEKTKENIIEKEDVKIQKTDVQSKEKTKKPKVAEKKEIKSLTPKKKEDKK